jgi:hypothetical protein
MSWYVVHVAMCVYMCMCMCMCTFWSVYVLCTCRVHITLTLTMAMMTTMTKIAGRFGPEMGYYNVNDGGCANCSPGYYQVKDI